MSDWLFLQGHEDEVYVLEFCPADPRILLSAGHDGKMNIWDIHSGVRIKKIFNFVSSLSTLLLAKLKGFLTVTLILCQYMSSLY